MLPMNNCDKTTVGLLSFSVALASPAHPTPACSSSIKQESAILLQTNNAACIRHFVAGKWKTLVRHFTCVFHYSSVFIWNVVIYIVLSIVHPWCRIHHQPPFPMRKNCIHSFIVFSSCFSAMKLCCLMVKFNWMIPVKSAEQKTGGMKILVETNSVIT